MLGDESHKELVVFLKNVSASLWSPSAIIVVSAHWEEDKPKITSGAAPSLIYDYYGFQKFCKLGDLVPTNYKLKQNSWESLKHNSKFSSMEMIDKILRLFK